MVFLLERCKMPLTRRELLKGMGLVAGGLGLAAAGHDHIVPFIHQPEDIIPGVAAWYATSCRECPAGCGMIVKNREGRVIKCEGNINHPVNAGTLCARGQAALHGLYDPDRIKGPLKAEQGRFIGVSWDDAISAVGEKLAGNPRIAIITDLETGSIDTLMKAWLSAIGTGRMVVYEQINYESVKRTNSGVVPTFDIAGSDYLVSFAADFLETGIYPVEYARQFREMRDVKNGTRGRFVYVGPRVSMTAANADERILVPPGGEEAVALAILSDIERGNIPPEFTVDRVAADLDVDPRQIRRVARGLAAASAPLALPGGDARTAAAVMRLNSALGSKLINRGRPHALTNTSDATAMSDLIADMENGQLDVLIIFQANPAYSLPESERFIDALKGVRTVISMSSFMDETSTYAHWILPSNTPLESWGDYEPYPGVLNILQPSMGTLYNTRNVGDILIDMSRKAGVDPQLVFQAENFYEYLRNRLGLPLSAGETMETSSPEWETLVGEGGRFSAVPVAVGTIESSQQEAIQPLPRANGDGIYLWAYPSIYFYDGRGANRRWLQEMPEPVTKCAWGTWAEMHPSTAKRLGVVTNNTIKISNGGGSIVLPVWVSDGVHPRAVAVPIGQGHSAYGRFASGTGANVWPLLTSEKPIVNITRAGRPGAITRWKGSTRQHGRKIAQTTPLGGHGHPREVRLPLPEGYKDYDFYPGHSHSPHRWAMVVDTNRCIGCNACVVACYAENNIGIVGASGIRKNREMAWLRIDPYFEKDILTEPVIFQPMLCQHCDSAPCETVCPVYAAAHTDDGINMQVYNRCVGTRYCANNCPYKVRRFNWFTYSWPEPLNYQLNPDVTVRDRGVMEKCTFCVQRIREAEIKAKREGRPIRDNEIIPACVQTCPTKAFTFGDLKDKNSEASRLIRQDPRAYQVLYELNTKTAVIYLRRIVEE